MLHIEKLEINDRSDSMRSLSLPAPRSLHYSQFIPTQTRMLQFNVAYETSHKKDYQLLSSSDISLIGSMPYKT